MLKNKISIYSPSACEEAGHTIYAQMLCKNLVKNFEISLYTLKHEQLNSILIKMGIDVQTTTLYEANSMYKNNFLKYKIFSSIIYGFSRIRYNYRLLNDYFERNVNMKTYHLYEFEYISLYFISFFRKKQLQRTILNFHSSEFRWIHGRNISVNIYKKFVSYLLPRLVKNSAAVTVLGQTLVNEFIISSKCKKYAEKIHYTGWGYDSEAELSNKIDACNYLNLEVKPYVLFFGALRKSKGILGILESFKNVNNDLTLIIAGSESDISIDKLNLIIEQNGIEKRVIKHIKYILEDEIKYYFGISDIVLTAHTSDFLSFSGPVALAVQYNRLFIASNVGEVGYFTRNSGIGRLYETENMENFVEVLNKLYEDQKLDSNNFNTNRKFVQNYSWIEISNRISSLYLKIQTKEESESIFIKI